MPPQKLRKLLSIDGGGVRGLSAIVVLEQLMDVANRKRKKNNLAPQEPWEMFDMIGGTSTGGLIAVMLGRLHMTLPECKAAYIKLSESVFTERNMIQRAVELWHLGPKFEHKPLEKAIEEILIKAFPDKPTDVLLQEDDDESKVPCKVFVLAHNDNMRGHPAILRSYRNDLNTLESFNEMRIWEACRATSAAKSYFAPIRVGDTTYSDGGVLKNNPVSYVHAEGSEMFQGDDLLLVSLGTGIASENVRFKPTLQTIALDLAAITTNTENEAHLFERRDGGKAVLSQRYFRFNVHGIGSIGLEESKRLVDIKDSTVRYLAIPGIGRQSKTCAMQLAEDYIIDRVLVEEIKKTLTKHAFNPHGGNIAYHFGDSFEWIWRPDGPGFIQWLENEQGIYWISGRPGSGKSTLMKYILCSSRTIREHLPFQEDQRTVVCQYFFSEISGHEQEARMGGLLHSLLHQLLVELPMLASCIEAVYNRLHKLETDSLSVWGQIDLEEALSLIIEQNEVSGHLCLFIDGFDECRGDNLDNFNLLSSWAGKKGQDGLRIKICLASRHLEELERFRGLRVHEWTGSDIHSCVATLWGRIPRALHTENPAQQERFERKLQEKVVMRSRGVFTWVKPIVTEILLGIDNRVKNPQVENYLNKLPEKAEKLGEFYDRLIMAIPNESLSDAFKYFQILLNSPGGAFELTLLQFSVASQDPHAAIDCRSQYDTDESYQFSARRADDVPTIQEILTVDQLYQMKTKIINDCRGMIEVQERRCLWDDGRQENVVFMHRTIVEYLKAPHVEKEFEERLRKIDKCPSRNIHVSMMSSYLWLLKLHPSYIPTWATQKPVSYSTSHPRIENHSSSLSAQRYVRGPFEWYDDEIEDILFKEEKGGRTAQNAIAHFFNYAQLAEGSTGEAQTEYIDALDKVLTLANKNWASEFFQHRTGHDFYRGDVMCLAICYKLNFYLKEKLEDGEYSPTSRQPLLWYAMNPDGWPHEPIDLDTLKIVIDNTDPSPCKLNGKERTLWEHAVRHLLRLDSDSLQDGWPNVLDYLLEWGADPTEEFECGFDSPRTVPDLLIEHIGKNGIDHVCLHRLLAMCFSSGAAKVPHLLIKHMGNGDAEKDNKLKKCLVYLCKEDNTIIYKVLELAENEHFEKVKECLTWLFKDSNLLIDSDSKEYKIMRVAKEIGPRAESLVQEALAMANVTKGRKRPHTERTQMAEQDAKRRRTRSQGSTS